MDRMQELSRQYLNGMITEREYQSALIARFSMPMSVTDLTALAEQLTMVSHEEVRIYES